jgi:SLT domain-containing protein/phage-related protein
MPRVGSSILVATGFVRIDTDTKPALKALQGFGSLAASALTTSLLPATAAASTAILSVASAASVAGAAVSVYAAAVVPQFKDIADASQQMASTEDAKAKATVNTSIAQNLARQNGFKYGQQVKITKGMTDEARSAAETYNSALSTASSSTKAASLSQALYEQKLASMPPATRKTAEAMDSLKKATKLWSASLSGSTMPVFTRGIQFLEGLLPKLTPIVRNVAYQVDQFVTSLGEGVAGKVFREFGHNVQKTAGGALKSFLDITRNLIVGIVGVLNAFMPMSVHMSGGLADLTERFAEWGAALGSSSGFHEFIRTAQDAGPELAELFKALASAIGDVSDAAGPLAGIGIKTITLLAKVIDALPTPVLQALVPAIIAVNLAMKVYAIYQAAASAATWLFSTAVTTSTGAMYTSRFAMISLTASYVTGRIATLASAAATTIWTVATRVATLAMTALRYALTLLRLGLVITAAGFRVLATAMLTNPIGLVITGLVALGVAFFILWKKSETFRDIVKGVWAAIQSAAQAVVNWFTGPFLGFFKAVWDTYYKIFVQPVLWFYTKALPAAARFLWQAVVAAFNALVGGVRAAWDLYLRLVIRPFLNFYTSVLPGAARYLWQRVTGFWGSILTGVQAVYASLRDRVFYPIGNFFTKTIPGWASTMSSRVRGFFSGMRDGIGTIWRGIQDKTKAPVNWVIDHVWNNGILNVWKTITGWIGIGNKLGKIRLLAAGGTVGTTPFGVFNKPTAIVGEGNSSYPEYVIPTDPKYATRARGLWESAGTHFMAGGGIIGTIGSAISSAAGKVTSIAKGAIDFFTDPSGIAKKLFNGPLGKLGGLKGGPWTDMVKKLPHMAVDGLLQAVKNVGSSVLGAVGLGSGSGGSGVQRYRGIVQILLRMLGQPAAYTDLTLRRMNQESGGNPRAVNLWDSNAAAGYPSVGLMQVIRGTFQAYAGKYRNTGPFMYGVSVDPAANVYASMQYALSRYGSLPRAYNRAGGYANGTAGTAGGMHLFGEHGPELGFTPSGWRILNSRRSAGMVGGTVVVEHLVVENHGVIASRREAEDWLVSSLDNLRRKNRI